MIPSTASNVREHPLAAAIAISIAIHAIVLAVFPQMRPLKRDPDHPLQVDLLPRVIEAAPAPFAAPVSEPVPVPKSVPVPPPERPRPKVTKPLSAQPAREAPALAQPAAPREELLTAAPEAPSNSSTFSVPAAPERGEVAPAPVRETAETASPPDPDLLAGYGHALSDAIGRHQRYPRLAQMRGWQGTATVALKFGAGNKLLATSLHRSSGHEVLDEQALQMVKDAQPLPSAPERLRHRDFTVLVPIVFRLKE
jgi:protein TonB